MSNSIRELIRADLLRDYQPPTPGLAARSLAAARRDFRTTPQAPQQRRHHGRSLVMEVAVSLLILVIGAGAVVGPRILQDNVVSLPGGLAIGGLRPPAADLSIVDYRFVSADIGWIVTQKGVHGGPTVLFGTRDGGRHWSEQLRFPPNSGSPDTMTFWPGGREGLFAWLRAGIQPQALADASGASAASLVPTQLEIYRTHDGGAHWQMTAEAPNGSTPFYINPAVGWKTVTSQLGTRTGQRATTESVLQTVDGGKHWTVVGQIPGTPGQLWFADSRTGWMNISDSRAWAFDASGKAVAYPAIPVQLYMTRDGGRTWQPQTVPLPPGAVRGDSDVRVLPPTLVDAADGLLPVQVIAAPSAPNGPLSPALTGSGVVNYVLRSTDGGAHWSDATRLPAGLDQGGEIFLSRLHWLVANGTRLMETVDAGASWSTRRVLADGFGFSLAPWTFIDQATIWSQAGPSSLIRSTDGGEHWTAMTPPEIR